MTKFIVGIVVGLFLGTATTVYGTGAGTVASLGWTATEDVNATCSDPGRHQQAFQ